MNEASLIDRMIRAARLDPQLYEEVERDQEALTQAMLVVIIASLASGIGSALASLLSGAGPVGAAIGLVYGILAALIGWFIWSGLTFWIGTKLMGGVATYGEMLRTLGFANTPQILGLFRFIPCAGPLIAFAGSIWALVAMVVAVRQGLDVDTGKAVVTVVIGWAVVLAITLAIGLLFGVGAVLGGVATGAFH
jgi:hypothetical protein